MQIRKVCDMHKPEGQTQISKPFFLNRSYESPFLPSALLKTPTLDKIDQDLIFTSSCSRHFSGHSHNTTYHIPCCVSFMFFILNLRPFQQTRHKTCLARQQTPPPVRISRGKKTGKQSKSHRQKVSIATILNASYWAYVPSINVIYILARSIYVVQFVRQLATNSNKIVAFDDMTKTSNAFILPF